MRRSGLGGFVGGSIHWIKGFFKPEYSLTSAAVLAPDVVVAGRSTIITEGLNGLSTILATGIAGFSTITSSTVGLSFISDAGINGESTISSEGIAGESRI